MLHDALDINNYINDGFERVCTVAQYGDNYWRYTQVNNDLMFSDHRSWIYFIVTGDTIVKIGETGNPLGIKQSVRGIHYFENNPVCGTTSRLGRYRKFCGQHDTDYVCRTKLREDVERGTVSIWAKACALVERSAIIQGIEKTATVSMHKDLEMVYLDNIFSQTGGYPLLNKARK